MMKFITQSPQTNKEQLKAFLWWIKIAFVTLFCGILTSYSHATQPLAGSIISSKATASYGLPGSIESMTTYSNVVEAIVQPVESFTLIQNNSFTRPAASIVTFPHTLTNIGNTVVAYTFNVDTVGCSGPNIGFANSVSLYLDVNGNGGIDSIDHQLPFGSKGVVSLSPGESTSLLLQGALPLASDGETSCIRLRVGSDSTGRQESNVDTVRISKNAAIVLSKTVNYSGTAQAGKTVLNYSVVASNIGNTNAVPAPNAPDASTILVNGIPTALIVIRDVMPNGLQYVPGTLHTDISGAVRLFRRAGDPLFSYHAESTPGLGWDDATAIEVAIGIPSNLSPNTTVSFDFQASLLLNAPPQVKNTAFSDYYDGSRVVEITSNVSSIKINSQVLGLAKSASMPRGNVDSVGAFDGTATVRFLILAHNYGSEPLYEVAVRDALENIAGGLGQYTSSALPQQGQYTVVANSIRLVSASGPGVDATVVAGFTGQQGNTDLLGNHTFLPPGGEIAVQFDVRFNVGGLAPILYNTANAYAATTANGVQSVSANSVNGVDPDFNHDGNPNAHASRTPYATQLPVLSLQKTMSSFRPVVGSVDTFDMDIALKVTNTSAVDAPFVRLADNLFCAFLMDQRGSGVPNGPIANWQIFGRLLSKNGLLNPNQSYTGGAFCDRIQQNQTDAFISYPFDTSLSLVDGTRTLKAGDSETISFTVRLKIRGSASNSSTVLNNRAWAGIFDGSNSGSKSLVWATSTSVSSEVTDPSGYVYDAQSRLPIEGALVNITRKSCQKNASSAITPDQMDGPIRAYTYNKDGSVSVTTDAGGRYAFAFKVPPVDDLCTYSVNVSPPMGSGYTFPSKKIQPKAVEFSSCGRVTSATGIPQGSQDTTYFVNIKAGKDPVTGTLCTVANNNIPLDLDQSRSNSGRLTLQKVASAANAEIGDIVVFTVTASNYTGKNLSQLSIKDQLPAGFRYIAGSTRMGDVSMPDPAGGNGPNLVFNSQPVSSMALNPGGSISLTYQVRIGINAIADADSINRAWAQATSPSSVILSNEADARVHVLGGVLSNDAYAFGKVFLDCNRNGIQDNAELGVPGVRLFMEDGTGAITDVEGKWSLYGLRPITHVLRVDTLTLPDGAILENLEPRQSGQPDSVFLDLKNGELHKVNFAVQGCDSTSLVNAIQSRRDAILSHTGVEGEVSRATTRLPSDANVVSPSDVRGLPSAGAIDAGGSVTNVTSLVSPLIGLPGNIGTSDFGTQSSVAKRSLHDSIEKSDVKPSPTSATGLVGANFNPLLEEILPKESRGLDFIGLKNGQILTSAVANVQVKGAVGSQLLLSVNGVTVDQSRVGKRARFDQNQTEAWEYVAVQFQQGVNTLKLQEVDAFGVNRGNREISITAPGTLAQIAIDVAAVASANESIPLPVTIRLLDSNGVPYTERTSITLESIGARWSAKDLNPLEAGVQIVVVGGSASLELVPPANPGEGKIRVSSGTFQSESLIVFLPDLKPLTGIGVLEGILNVRNLANMQLGAPSAADAFESELRGWTDSNKSTQGAIRSAFYFKGVVKGDYLLTAAYDSDKTAATPMFRDIQPDKFYPVYGDSSVKTFDAQSSQRLYVRIDKNRSYLLYGDFNTASSTEVRKLSQVSRSATGVQHVYNSGDVRVTSHYSRDTLKQVIEEFPANGTSGPYALTKSNGSDLFANSEVVQLVVRDRNQPNSIISATALNRIVDYTIEPLSKTILFTRPIGSLDQDLNPQSIRINYVVDAGGTAFDVAGTDVQLRVSDRLQLGLVTEVDDAPGNKRELTAVTALTRVDDSTVISGELVGTKSDLRGIGQAYGLELRHDDSLLKYNLHVQASDASFDNPTAAIASGRTEARGHLDYQISPETHIKGELVYAKESDIQENGDSSNSVKTQGLSVSLQSRVSPNITAEVGVRSGKSEISAATGFDYGTTTGASTGTASTLAGNATQDMLAVRARVSAKISDVPSALVYAEAEQDVNDSEHHSTALGGNYALNEKTRIYGRYEVISSLGSEYSLANGIQRNVGLVGVDSAYMPGGRIYDEYRIADTIDGRSMQSATGVRNAFAVSDSLRLTGSIEQVSALPVGDGTYSGQSTAVAGSFDWLGVGESANRLRSGGSLELRDGSDAMTRLLTLGLAYKFDSDWSFLTRAAVNRVSNRTDGSVHWLEREQIGIAYRPVDQDVWNALWRYEHKTDLWNGALVGTLPTVNTTTDIVSAHLNYQPYRGDIVSGRMAYKFSKTDSYGVGSTYDARLFHGRWTHDIDRDWDMGVQYGLYMGNSQSLREILGIEVGYQVSQGLWLSAGYNILGVRDQDLVGSDYTDSGVYMRLRFKFDERLFNTSMH